MSLRKTFITARRVLSQLRHDPRTLGIVIVVPCVLLYILKYVFDGEPKIFNQLAPMMLGIFPLLMMFLITSIATLRERTTGTLDRLMTQPISKLDLMFGYALAFSLLGLVQASAISFVALKLLGVTVSGGAFALIIAAVSAAFLGTSLGLFVSAFATSEFQAVELVMPIHVSGPTALAAADDRTLYVAAAGGLTRVDIGARTVTHLTSTAALKDFVTLYCRPGSLIGMQRDAGGASLVQLRLDPSGSRALSRDVLVSSLHETAGALAGDSFYYLVEPGIIRKLTVK